MPLSQYDSPPLIEDKENFREYLLKLHDDVYGLGDDTTGTLDVNFNLATEIMDSTVDATITGEWTFSTHPLGLDHTLIANIGTNTHTAIDTHIADTTLHFTEGSIDHSAITNLNWSATGHTIDANLLPDTDDSYDLGSTTVSWQDAYLTGLLYFDDTNSLTHDGTDFVFNDSMKADTSITSEADGANALFRAVCYTTAGVESAKYLAATAKGTLASPTAVENNYILFNFTGRGHDGVTFQDGGTMRFTAVETWDNAPIRRGTKFELRTYARSGGGSASRFEVDNDGDIRFPNDDQNVYWGAGQEASIYYTSGNVWNFYAPYRSVAFTGSQFTFQLDNLVDVPMNFVGGTNNGLFTWMEDEDYFDFADTIKSSAGRIQNITEYSASNSYTALATDYHISIKYTNTGPFTLTLPAITAVNHGQVYVLKDADYNASGNNITVTPNANDEIEKSGNGTSGTMAADGEAWMLIANYDGGIDPNWEMQ